MKKNEDVCQDMDVSEILCFLRAKYANVSSRSYALCNQLKLSYDEYKQINSVRQIQLLKKRSQQRLSIQQMNCRANNIIQHSDNPRQLLPCLVLITGIKPTLLLKNEHQNLTSIVSTKLKICKEKWPCETLTCLEMHDKYQALWRYHLKQVFPSITFAQLCRALKNRTPEL